MTPKRGCCKIQLLYRFILSTMKGKMCVLTFNKHLEDYIEGSSDLIEIWQKHCWVHNLQERTNMTGTICFLVSKSRWRFLSKDKYTTANVQEAQRDFWLIVQSCKTWNKRYYHHITIQKIYIFCTQAFEARALRKPLDSSLACYEVFLGQAYIPFLSQDYALLAKSYFPLVVQRARFLSLICQSYIFLELLKEPPPASK